MQKRFYVDTCIWRDLLEDRKSGYSFLGENAFLFIKQCREFDCIIVVSSLVLQELQNEFAKEEIDSLFEPFIELIIFVEYSDRDLDCAHSLFMRLGIHKSDALHTVICKRTKCDLVTRDKHFELIKELVKVFKPEEVIFD